MANARSGDSVLPHNSGAPSTHPFTKSYADNGLHFLQHSTLICYLADILNSGRLVPRARQEKHNFNMGGNGDVVYLSPYFSQTSDSQNSTISALSSNYDLIIDANGMVQHVGNLSSVILLFSLALLTERNDYYVNDAWSTEGVLDDKSNPPEAILNNRVMLSTMSEVCFKNPIDLSNNLVEIWVHPSKKDEVISALKERKVDSFWLNRIVAYEYHPKIEQHLSDIRARTAENKNASEEDRRPLLAVKLSRSTPINRYRLLAVQPSQSMTVTNNRSTTIAANPLPNQSI